MFLAANAFVFGKVLSIIYQADYKIFTFNFPLKKRKKTTIILNLLVGQVCRGYWRQFTS